MKNNKIAPFSFILFSSEPLICEDEAGSDFVMNFRFSLESSEDSKWTFSRKRKKERGRGENCSNFQVEYLREGCTLDLEAISILPRTNSHANKSRQRESANSPLSRDREYGHSGETLLST